MGTTNLRSVIAEGDSSGLKSLDRSGSYVLDSAGAESSSGAFPPRCHGACVSRTGEEPDAYKVNQDSCFAYDKFLGDDQAIFGVLDGHGPFGHFVSSMVRDRLPDILADTLDGWKEQQMKQQQQDSGRKKNQNSISSLEGISTPVQQAFLACDQVLEYSALDTEFSGTTAVVTLILGGFAVTAWVGDSRGMLIQRQLDGSHKAIKLTEDHTPANHEESQRILGTGGRIERLIGPDGSRIGPARVWLSDAWIPGLAMSRALGDTVAKHVGVSATPDVNIRKLGAEDEFLVLASDGVWEFISEQEAANLVVQYRGEDVRVAALALVEYASKKWRETETVIDDITAVVVRLGGAASE